MEKASPTAKASNNSTGRAWIWAEVVVVPLRVLQRQLRRERAKTLLD